MEVAWRHGAADGAHTDYEGFTILQRGDEAAELGSGGLEVQDALHV